MNGIYMDGMKRILRVVAFWGIIFVGGVSHVMGQGNDSLVDVSSRKFVHGLRVEGRPEYVFPTSSFLQGENVEGRIIQGVFSSHLKYLFRYRPGSFDEHIYGDVYQGVGVGFYNFGGSRQLGNPVAFYLFQGARISSLAPWLLCITNGISGCPRGGRLMTRIIIRPTRLSVRR